MRATFLVNGSAAIPQLVIGLEMPRLMEHSPYNTLVKRSPNGIWSEDVLPVLEWEVAEERKVLPQSVQELLGCNLPVLRVSVDVDQKQRGKHRDIATFYHEFNLESWAYVRTLPDEDGIKWEFVQIMSIAPELPWPLMVVIGKDRPGSFNLVSMHRRNRRWLRKLLQGELDFEEREK